jgi:hypothetical protein
MGSLSPLFGIRPKLRWVEWFNAHADEMEAPEFSDRQAGTWSKLRAQAAKFALVLARLRWASEPPPLPPPGPRFAPVTGSNDADESDVRGAIKLATYFKSHLLRVIHQMTGALGSADAKRIVDWVRRKGLTEFRTHDVGADLRNFRDNPKALAAALTALVDAGAIRPKGGVRNPSTPGRKPTDAYDVHPELLRAIAPQNTRNTRKGPSDATAESISGNSGNSWRTQGGGSADPPPAPADGGDSTEFADPLNPRDLIIPRDEPFYPDRNGQASKERPTSFAEIEVFEP